ncbi:MAG: biotin--[acetyl-CoA-carboxylase] ligase [Zetaproteobacteria bacterium]|nr:biotin--[acetyl-CoA-carboxylase] ligase [Zetaproteobacteria bacterium]
MQPFNEVTFRSHLQSKHFGQPCLTFNCIDSTNSEWARQLQHDNPIFNREGALIVAQSQQHGRGRLGRSWYNHHNSTLTMSILLTPPETTPHICNIPLIVAVAIQQAFPELSPLLAIKWPNDILYHQRKLAGILVERSQTADYPHAIIVGIGINIHHPAHGYPDEISATAIALNEISTTPIDISIAACRIIESLEHYYHQWLQEGFGPIQTLWWQAHAGSHRCIRAYDSERGYIDGIAVGLDLDGALLLQTTTSIERIIAGEVEIL